MTKGGSPSWINLRSTQQDEMAALLPPLGSWRMMAGADLPSVLPPTFRRKIDSALVIAEQTPTEGIYLVCSALRIDRRPAMIDIEPFGVIVHSTGPSPSGVFVHHGQWSGRSQQSPREFWKSVDDSGIGKYFLAHSPDGLREGTLDQLPYGHRGAFDVVVYEIRAREDAR